MSETAAPEVLWLPTRQRIESTRLWELRELVRAHGGPTLEDYPSFWRWSVTEPNAFWDAVRQLFGMVGEGLHEPALALERMPGAVWYPDARVNYAENVLRHALERPDDVAVIHVEEDLSRTEWSWADLAGRVGAFQGRLRGLGVVEGDVVGAVLPNIPATLVAMLATAGLGAIWSVCSPDLAVGAILDRLAPLRPKVLVGGAGYEFKGRRIDTRPALAEIAAGIPDATVIDDPAEPGGVAGAAPEFVRVGFAHPLWVLFSSGTSGSPKGIVHGHGGMMLEAFKGIGLQFDLRAGDHYFTAANTSWMVWNTLPNTLLNGAAVVSYAGAPTFPRVDRQFEVVATAGVTMMSTGAAFLDLVARSGARPKDDLDFSRLELVMSTGSVLAPSTWRWVHEAVKADMHVSSDSGGTDICSGFLGGNPWQPEIVGELQCATLGAAVDVHREDGSPAAVGEVGEMVITRPMPSMPVRFWNDPDGALYRAAYFQQDPEVWTHGDWISRTEHGGFIIAGRSDATLNRDGVRLGSADIYAALQAIPEVRNAVVLGIEIPGGRYWMPLFVELVDGAVLDEELVDRIATTIRGRASARHVPDTVEAVPGIPITHAGKRIEIPLKKLFLGHPARTALNRGSLQNPHDADWFVARADAFVAENGIGRR